MPGEYHLKPLSQKTRPQIIATALAFLIIGALIFAASLSFALQRHPLAWLGWIGCALIGILVSRAVWKCSAELRRRQRA